MKRERIVSTSITEVEYKIIEKERMKVANIEGKIPTISNIVRRAITIAYGPFEERIDMNEQDDNQEVKQEVAKDNSPQEVKQEVKQDNSPQETKSEQPSSLSMSFSDINW